MRLIDTCKLKTGPVAPLTRQQVATLPWAKLKALNLATDDENLMVGVWWALMMSGLK
jgi:hypothetical protein